MALNRVSLKPELLSWAIKRSGKSLSSLYKKFPKLSSWEEGRSQPTLKQLERLAKSLYAPIGYFFLSKPLKERSPIPDFRKMAIAKNTPPSPDLLETIYICQRRQDWYKEHQRLDRAKPLYFIGSVKKLSDENIVKTALNIRKTLNFDIEKRKKLSTWTEALRQFIEMARSKGILVMFSGIVGNNARRKLNPKEFRGFALSDPLAPLIFINGADSKTAQMFTLAHELAHLWIAQTAVSDTQASDIDEPEFALRVNKRISDYYIEKWCNKVAAETLAPLDLIRKEASSQKHHIDFSFELGRLARYFKVSSLVILRRLYDLKKITAKEFYKKYKEELEKINKIQGKGKTGGGEFFRTFNSQISPSFTKALLTSALEGQTAFREAFQLLGVKKMSTFKKIGNSLGVKI